jgi:hypothetical protein
MFSALFLVFLEYFYVSLKKISQGEIIKKVVAQKSRRFFELGQ